MQAEIFRVEDGRLIVNEHVLSIPELRAVYEYYPDPIPALQYLRNLCDPYGPYNNIPEEEKQETIYNDFPGGYSSEDPLILEAKDKLISLYMSPTYRWYLDNKTLLETVGKWARTAVVDDERSGNLGAILQQLNSLGKVMGQFKMLEKQADEEMKKSKIRGNQFQAYDLEEEDDD